MTINERNQRIEHVTRLKENYLIVSESLEKKAKSFKILSDMCDYLITRLKQEDDFDYESLQKFVDNEYQRLIKDDR